MAGREAWRHTRHAARQRTGGDGGRGAAGRAARHRAARGRPGRRDHRAARRRSTRGRRTGGGRPGERYRSVAHSDRFAGARDRAGARVGRTPVCAVGNAFGLDLSVTCGVVSATRRSGVGFNPVEDFIQTDASVNPGASGGALVDGEGRLVGLLSAIFTKEVDADIGVNFAVSSALLMQVVEDLAAHGQVLRPRSGFRVEDLNSLEASEIVGVRVVAVTPGGAGEAAGLAEGDLVTAIAGRRMRKASDATAAIQLQRPGDRVALQVLRAGALETLALDLPP